MKETGGKADPRVVNERVREKLRRVTSADPVRDSTSIARHISSVVPSPQRT